MQSYSQRGQDKFVYFVYEPFFNGRPEPGTFVDVGAYDGITFSNTLLFERLGWSGVCIKPLLVAFERLKTTRSSICMNCAVADAPGTGTLVQIDMPSGFEQMYSGLQSNFNQRYRKIIEKWGSNRIDVTVQIRCLAHILTECGIRGIDYLPIEMEGPSGGCCGPLISELSQFRSCQSKIILATRRSVVTCSITAISL